MSLPLRAAVLRKINTLKENQVPSDWQENKRAKEGLLLQREITLEGDSDFKISICYGCQLTHSITPVSENIIDLFAVTIPAAGMC